MNADLLESLSWNEKISTQASYLLVAGMMTCLLSTLALLGQAIAPDWQGGYFGPLAFIISLEALYVYQSRRRLTFPEAEWFGFFAAEWGMIVVVLRALIYIKQGLAQLWIDLSSGPNGFLEGFFNGEFTAALIGVILIWFLTNWFADLLAPLRNDATLVILAGGADTSVERHAVRRQLANMVLVIGVFMALLTAGMRSESFTSWARIPLMRSGVLNVMIYFVFALLLLSQTQFALLRARWGLNRVKVGRKIAITWIAYTLVFLTLVGLISLVLPTGYTFGLLSLLNYLFELIYLLGVVILWLLSIPIYFLSVLLSSLFGISPLERIPPPRIVPPPAVDESAANLLPFWMEMARSVIFWALLIAALGFTLVYFLRSRRQDIIRLGRMPLFRWLKDWLLLFKQSMVGARLQIGEITRQGLALLRRPRSGSTAGDAWSFLNLRRLSARSKVRFYYQAMLRRAGETGHARRVDQTPVEFARSLDGYIQSEADKSAQVLDESAAKLGQPELATTAVSQLTEAFIQARYSLQEITVEQAGLAQQAWDHLRRVMQRWKKPGGPAKGGQT